MPLTFRQREKGELVPARTDEAFVKRTQVGIELRCQVIGRFPSDDLHRFPPQSTLRLNHPGFVGEPLV